MRAVDIRHELNGTICVWNARKVAANSGKYDGITFEQAATVCFDPFFRLVDAVIGCDALSRLVFVVQVELDGQAIRIISARKATHEERKHHDL